MTNRRRGALASKLLQEQDVREAAEQRRASDNTTLAECLNLITPSAKQQTHHHVRGDTIRHCTMDIYNSSTTNIKQNQPSVCTAVEEERLMIKEREEIRKERRNLARNQS
jgi:hypothetical protein